MPLKTRGIGQRALQRAAFAGESRGKRRLRHAEHFESARVVVVERLFARHHVKRGALLRSGFGQDQRAVRKIERGKAHAACERRAGRLPAQPPRDHQVQHEEARSVELEDDPLADASQSADDLAVQRRQRRIHRPHEERARQPHALEGSSDHARLERVQVERDVRQLRHGDVTYMGTVPA